MLCGAVQLRSNKQQAAKEHLAMFEELLGDIGPAERDQDESVIDELTEVRTR